MVLGSTSSTTSKMLMQDGIAVDEEVRAKVKHCVGLVTLQLGEPLFNGVTIDKINYRYIHVLNKQFYLFSLLGGFDYVFRADVK